MAADDRHIPARAADSEHPACRFDADCALQLDVCNSLLAVADRLPESLNVTAIQVLSKLLQSTWSSHLALQGEAILPLVEKRHKNSANIRTQFESLTRQHIEISGSNDELVEFFGMISRGERVETGMLGYVIRNNAERRREHIGWEKVILAPLLPEVLTPDERRVFSNWAARNPWPFDDFKNFSFERPN